ncbi:UNVERIFIED_CONTAM: hypothetical protein RMT77_010121 [Armadillidium vulgare]
MASENSSGPPPGAPTPSSQEGPTPLATDQTGGKVNQAEASFLGFYNSMASCFKKYAANVPNPLRKMEGDQLKGSSSPPGGRKSSTASSTGTAPGTDNPQQSMQPMDEPEIPELPLEPELPPGVLCQLDGNIVFRILTEDYVEEAVNLLCNHFFKDEPLGKALYLQSPGEVDHWLSKALPHMIRHEVSVMAQDESEEGQGRLVGVAINSVKLKGQPRGPDDFLTWLNPQKDPKMYRILSFLNQVAADIDFYSNYNVDKLFFFELLNVDKIYGGRGIASMLVEQSISVARERDFKCLVAETTGIFSAKIFARNGFKTIREVPYASQRENGRLVFPSTGIHTSARVSVKILQSDEKSPNKTPQSKA